MLKYVSDIRKVIHIHKHCICPCVVDMFAAPPSTIIQKFDNDPLNDFLMFSRICDLVLFYKYGTTMANPLGFFFRCHIC